MAWNEPGGSKDNDPWSRPRNEKGPPDLDEVVRKLQERITGWFGGGGKKGLGSGGGSGKPVSPLALAGAVVLAGVAYVFACLYTIQPAEKGVVLRLGKFHETTGPGLNWLIFPIDTVEKVNVDEIRTVEIGFRTNTRGGSSANQSSQANQREALMLTRDENIVDIKLAVQYKIKDLAKFLFKIVEPELALRRAAESAVREAVGQSDMDTVLTDGRSDITARVQVLVQEILDRYEAGLQVTSVNLQDAQPPKEVQESFNDAVRAREDEQRLINDAQAYANDILPKADGFAERTKEEARGYSDKVQAEAKGEAARFELILAEYLKAPEVTRRRLYLDAMEYVMSQSSKVVVDVPSGNMLVLPLDKLGSSLTGEGPVDQIGSAIPPDDVVPSETTPAEKVDRTPQRDVARSRERR